MNNTLGIIFSNMHEHTVSELTVHRCMGSIPVGGRYRLIDFALSSMTNAGIESVGVITKSNYQSLMDHLGNGSEWDLSRKHGGLVILPPFGRTDSGMYRSRVEAFAGIMEFMQSTGLRNVLCMDCDIIANIDLSGFIRSHHDSGAEISVMCKKMEVQQNTSRDIAVLTLNEENRVTDMLLNPYITGEYNVYMNTMLLSRSLLEKLIGDCQSRNLFHFEKDVLQASIKQYKVHAYEFNGYVARFDGMKTYFSTNMSMLDPAVREALFPRERPVYTKVRDEAPVRYGLAAQVKNCLLADGCVIEGDVENSILFRGVHVKKNAKVRNSIVMQGSTIGEQAMLEYIITDKNVTISDTRTLMGFSTCPMYIAKGSIV